jgi:ABC-2 type transport system ATP-binding protein
MTHLIEVSGLGVRFGKHEVLQDLSLEAAAGQIIGIRGPNGVGKTTLVNVLLGLQKFAGEVKVLGHDPRARLGPEERPGVLLTEDGLYEELTARAQLALYERMFGPKGFSATRIHEIAEEVKLISNLDETPKNWSSGMRRRLALARCFLLDKPLYVLDEPERGIDAQGREWLEHKLLSLKASGQAVLLTSHDNTLLDAACDEVYLLEQGKLHPDQHSRCWVRIFTTEAEALKSYLAAFEVLWMSLYPGRLECGVDSKEVALKLLAALPCELARHVEVRW